MKDELVCVVLAAGVGKRFWPFTVDKPLFPYMGRPLLEHILNGPLPKQVSKLVVVASPKNFDHIKKCDCHCLFLLWCRRKPTVWLRRWYLHRTL